jgi:branched-chain amino acid transport system ATP-binding protein
MADQLLSVAQVSVRHGATVALDAVTLTVGSHEVIGVFGPNGAGKSTLMNAIMGLAKLDSGSIKFDDATIDRLPTARRARLGIGYVPQGRRVFAGMTVDENLAVACRGTSIQRHCLADEMFALFPPLAERRRSIGWQLSGGEQQMLSLARALMGEPRLLLADEPTLGLSPQAAAQVLEKLQNVASLGTGVLLCEQNDVSVVERCDRGHILQLGKISTEGAAPQGAEPGLIVNSTKRDGFLAP